MAALRWLGRTHPDLFPGTLIRQEAPDFVIEPRGNGTSWAIEHTDAADEELQRWLRDSELSITPSGVPNRGGRLSVGDAADVLFAQEVGRAIGAKIAKDSFRRAPAGALRCVLIYGHSRFVVDVTVARCALAAALAALRAAGASIDAALLLFSREVNGEAVMDLAFVPAEEPTP